MRRIIISRISRLGADVSIPPSTLFVRNENDKIIPTRQVVVIVVVVVVVVAVVVLVIWSSPLICYERDRECDRNRKRGKERKINIFSSSYYLAYYSRKAQARCIGSWRSLLFNPYGVYILIIKTTTKVAAALFVRFHSR